MADTTTTNESVTEVVSKVLRDYLKANISSLREVLDEFPTANMTLKLPSISIISSSNVVFAPKACPSPLAPINPAAINNFKVPVLYNVGDYDFSIQLDLWAANKEERDDLYDTVFNVLNPDISPMGLRLKMDEYFGTLCDYLYVGHSFADSEERSQRNEWRATLNLVATCIAVRTRKEFVIDTTEVNTQVLGIGESDPDI